jgi:hypothetical protein
VSRRRPARSLRRALGLFLLANILPIVALGWIAIQHARGEFEIRALPPGTTETLIVLGVAVVLLFLVASVSLPAAHRVVTELECYMAYRKAILFGHTPGSRLLSLLLLPLLPIPYLVAWPIRLVLILISLALIAVILVFLVRLFRPDFLQDWIERGLAALRF